MKKQLTILLATGIAMTGGLDTALAATNLNTPVNVDTIISTEIIENTNLVYTNHEEIINRAKSIIGYWTYSQENRTSVLNNLEPADPNDQTDGSGFVYWVLKTTGHNVNDDMWWTGEMQEDINGHQNYLLKLSPGETQAGDIIIQHDPNHIEAARTAILLEKWRGSETRVLQIGLSQDGVQESTTGASGLETPTSFGRPIIHTNISNINK
ncbi:hypothetical protein [Hutsoniella sourekii]|uniref:hypothetical protein n=1 Tax=Hutsoniella sourekii TaxID=87650 RepID=UPI000482E3E2|nr:hypothetical protein [Hutsoniella sourekii]